MDAERERIHEDLRGLVAGEVFCDELFLQLWASDASIYEINPLAVVRPRHTRDVVAVVQYAAENQLPIHARGAGTGLAGESLGRGIVLDFSRFMRKILWTSDDAVRVQPGVVLASLNAHLAPLGKQFGPDPAMSHVTTLGSVIAVDAAGSHWPRYGSARSHVASLQVVLADGQVMELADEPIPHGDDPTIEPRRRDLVGQVAELIRNNRELIEQNRPRSLVNNFGYVLDDVVRGDSVHMARLLSGSEGTLALVTEATLAVDPTPAVRGVALLLFDSLDAAVRAALELQAFTPSACDMMDRRHLSLARESDVRYDVLIPAETEALLLVEQEGDSVDAVRDSLSRMTDRVRRRKRLAFGAHVTLDPEDVELYLRLARTFVPTLYRLRGSTRPLPFLEDIAVPPERLPEFLVTLQNTLKRHQVTASLFGHVGHGQLHVRPFLDLSDPADRDRMQSLAEGLYQDVIEAGGTISGEHADGLSRTGFLRMQYGPLCDVFRDLKRIFDPLGILNPGKIVRHEPLSLTANLRPVTFPALAPGGESTAGANAPSVAPTESANGSPRLELQLAWQPEEMVQAARQCNGCGACRSQTGAVRMCPIFHLLPREEASPRAKANLVRGVLTGRLDGEQTARDEFKEVADLCVHCHQCRLECPAEVDIPRLMVEAKAAYVRANGLPPGDWMLARVDALSRQASRLPRLANWAIGNRQARWVIEKLLGIALGRKLPRLASRPFLRLAARRRLTRPTRQAGAKVMYFVDTFANYHDVELAEALVHVFEHNGVSVYVHPEQRPAGMAMISQGLLDPAKKLARHNVELLADAVRQGYTIVASEPAAVLCLTREYPQLLGDDDSRLVAEHTIEACHYLWNLHQLGKLRLDFEPLTASLAYHQPCHLRALGVGSPGENLLRLVPGLSVTHVEKGCSGMAGIYGLQRANYRSSLRAGWPLISALRELSAQAGTTECCTCKMQMEQGTSKPTIHPIKLLALAYDLMPEISQRLTEPGEDLVLT